MSTNNSLEKLQTSEEVANQIYQYINVFKNPSKLPINQIHIEKSCRQLKKVLPKDLDFINRSPKEIEEAYFETVTNIIPALDWRWLPETFLHEFEPFSIIQEAEDSITFLTKNLLFLDGLDFLLQCNFHQFWCTILFEPSAVIALRSFLLAPILPCQFKYLVDDYLEVYMAVYNRFLLVYEKLLNFKPSETEFMASSFGLSKLIEKKLLNLPIVITLAVLYKDRNYAFVKKVVDMYFNNISQVDFLIKEVEIMIDQNLIILEMIDPHVCGFGETANIVPFSIEKRPAIFSLSWVSSVVNYLLNVILTLNALFHFYKPAIEMALNKDLPFRLPFIYVNVYKELYELLDQREEEHTKQTLFKNVIEGISMGRSEFIELFHAFVSNCLDEALKHMGDKVKQEYIAESYLKLLTTALEAEYFIADYNQIYNVANQNEMFESCCDIDPTRTQFIVSCISKVFRNKTLRELSKSDRKTVENVFKQFACDLPKEPEIIEEQPSSSGGSSTKNNEADEKIQNIIDMFPHLGDGFVLQCLEAYNFNTPDVINAILENNLPPHLAEIPFDSIRIPPEPEPEKPILAYKGKKPEFDDALKLLNDKKEKAEIKNLVLEGIQFNTSYDMYDDEYDDRDDDVSIPVPDNPVSEEIQTFNPNRLPNRPRESESESESEAEASAAATSSDRSKFNFCEDPAVLRERREAKFRSKHPNHNNGAKPKGDVVGKAKGQGQDKSTLINRQKKNVNKSSRANHNRKGGAQFKRNKGMIPS